MVYNVTLVQITYYIQNCNPAISYILHSPVSLQSDALDTFPAIISNLKSKKDVISYLR